MTHDAGRSEGKTICVCAVIIGTIEMPFNLRFLYFGYQCPHNTYLLARIKTLAWKESVPLHMDDVSGDPEKCEEYRLYSPTTLIVNDRLRWLGPFSREEVLAMLYDEELPPRERPALGDASVVEGELSPITPESVLSTCAPCLMSDDIGLCRGKAEWTQTVLGETGTEHLGYLHFADGRCVGGAEYLPSTRVPYPIPDKRKGNAFLTCSFRSDVEKDYMSFPLRRLTEELGSNGYDTLSAVCSTNTTFPNGPVERFERMGFEKKEVLTHEELHDTDLVFMQMPL